MGATDDPEAIIEWNWSGNLRWKLKRGTQRGKTLSAFAIIYFVWGSTFSPFASAYTKFRRFSGGDTFLDCGARSLWLDDCSWRALAQQAPMGRPCLYSLP